MQHLLETEKYKILKSIVLAFYPDSCMRCGYTNGLQVDHIKPKSIHPSLIYDIRNLQVLCSRCNKEKGYFCETDYRTKEQKEELDHWIMIDEVFESYANTDKSIGKKYKSRAAYMRKKRKREIKDSKRKK